MKLDRPKYKNFAPGKFPTRADGFDICELKYDGWWGQLLIDGRDWFLYSRTGQLKRNGELSHYYARTTIHGEWIFGTEWAEQHEEYHNQIAVFGLTELEGKDITAWPNHEARFILSKLLFNLSEESILGGLFLVHQYHISHATRLWALNEEFEGLVFKDSQAPWGTPFGRMKREATMDYVCLGFEHSEADRHKGWGVASVVGGLYFDGVIQRACSTSSLSDEQRMDFYNNPDRYVGQVFEVKGKKITKNGSMRSPDFIRWRPDKRPEECVWSTKR